MRIIVAGLSKSGTTALFFKVKRSLAETSISLFEPKEPTADFQAPNVIVKMLIDRARDYSVQMDAFSGYDKKVLIVRDPRDQLVSSFLYNIRHSVICKEDRKLEIFLDKLKEKERDPQSVSLIQLFSLLTELEGNAFDPTSLLNQIQLLGKVGLGFANQHPDYFLISYEDFIAGNISALEKYMGFPLYAQANVTPDLKRVERTKGSGSWRHWFTPIDIAFFREAMHPFMQRFGYENDWQLAPQPVILPEHSSLYVRSLVRQKTEEDAYALKERQITATLVEKERHITALKNVVSGKQELLEERGRFLLEIKDELQRSEARNQQLLTEYQYQFGRLQTEHRRQFDQLRTEQQYQSGRMRAEYQRQVEQLRGEQVKTLATEKIIRDREISQLKNRLFHETEYRKNLERSATFKILKIYQKLIAFLLPEHSFRRRQYDKLIHWNQLWLNGDLKREGSRKDQEHEILRRFAGSDILFVNHEESRTGAPRVFFDIVKYFREKTTYRISILSKRQGSMHEEFVREFKHVLYPDEFFYGSSRFEKARKVLQGIRPKVVYVNCLVSYEYAVEAEKLGIPVIFHIHELDMSFSRVLSAEERKQFGAMADVFIAASKEVSDYLISTVGCDPRKVRIIHEFIDVDRVVRLSKERVSPLKKEGKVLIMASGTFSERKGADLFYQAVEIVSQKGYPVQAVWMGEHIHHFPEWREKLSRPESAVQLIGEKENPFPYLRQADIFVMSSREDPFPLVVLEALALGKPVVAFGPNVGSKEALDNNTGVIVQETTAEALAEALEDSIKRLPGRTEKTKEFGPLIVKQKYDISILAPQFLEAVEGMISHPSKTSAINKKVSLIIPSYNYGWCLRDTLDSALQQTHQNMEILVVDDFSTDSSLQIIKEYQQKYPVKIRHIEKPQADKGLAGSLRAGIRHSTGDFVAFLEADDLLLPDSIEKRLQSFQQHPEVALVYTGVDMFGPDADFLTYKKLQLEKHLAGKPIPFEPFDFSSYLTDRNVIETFSAVMVRKEHLTHVDFSAKYEAWFDWWFYLQLSKKGKFIKIPEKLTRWRIHPKSYNAEFNKNAERASLRFSQMQEEMKSRSMRAPVATLMASSEFQFFSIRGHARSGTNWLGNILNLHPEIYCAGEFHMQRIRRQIDAVIQFPTLLSQQYIAEPFLAGFEQIAKATMLKAYQSSGKKNVIWVGDRTPDELEPILIQNSTHFWIMRDGRDVLVSWIYHFLRMVLNEDPFKQFKIMQQYRLRFQEDPQYFKNHPEELLADEQCVRFVARTWARYITSGFEAMKKVQKGEISARIYAVTYEDLHKDIEKESKKLYAFLGLNPNQARPLDELTRPGFAKENPNSFLRKGAVGDWKNYFTPQAKTWFKEEAGEALIAAGYETDLLW